MKTASFKDRLAVCSWSLRPRNPQELIEQLTSLGIPRAQIALDPLREQPALWGALPDLCAAAGVQLVSGMFGTVGEDYTTMESIRLTGGVAPDATWDENRRRLPILAQLAGSLHLRLVTFHAGFLPEDEQDPAFGKLVERLRVVADVFGEKGIELAFETGQETGESLRRFLSKLDRANVGVNFDPANMILYDKGDPIQALRTLAPWLKQCHLKDATKTRQAGAWGEEVPVGAGEVNWVGFFQVLEELNFGGWLAIEREAGEQRLEDIRTGHRFLETVWRQKCA